MKRYTFFRIIAAGAACLICLSACRKETAVPEEVEVPWNQDSEGASRTLTFRLDRSAIGGATTKVHTDATSVTVDNWAVFLYATKDAPSVTYLSSLVPKACAHASSGADIKMDVDVFNWDSDYTKALSYVAIGNYTPAMWTSLSTGGGAPSLSFSEDNPDQPFMYAYGRINSATADQVFNVALTRAMCKVSVESITNSQQSSSSSVTVKGLYLINAPGDYRLQIKTDDSSGSGSYNPSDVSAAEHVWNPSAPFTVGAAGYPSSTGSYAMAGAAPAVMSDVFTATIAHGATLSTAHHLYCYPNPSALKTETSLATVKASSSVNDYWSWRCARVSVLASVGGADRWFPASLPAMEPGKWYDFLNITLKTTGSDSPETSSTDIRVSYTLRITDWTGTTIYEYL